MEWLLSWEKKMDGWMDGWIDGWMDGWMDGRWMNYAAHRKLKTVTEPKT